MTASTLFDTGPGDRPRREPAPGAVHVPSWLATRPRAETDEFQRAARVTRDECARARYLTE
jgi:hypothetical protein